MSAFKVGIIGAGIAGISCANFLVQHGHEVTIFEKSRGIGGRMSHRIYEGWEADHGAQYFTAQEPLFQDVLRDWLENNVVKIWDGKMVSFQQGNVTDLPRQTLRYVGVPAMNAPIKWLAKDLSIHYSHTISTIQKKSEYWHVETTEKGLIEEKFDYLILAIPPLQAEKLIQSYSEKIRSACLSVKMLPCWTLLSYFNTSVPLLYDAAFVQQDIFSWIARDNSKPNRPHKESWVAQTNPIWSEEHIDLPKAEVEHMLAQHFFELTRTKCEFQQLHLWRFARVAQESSTNFLIDQDAQLAVCGDWLRSSKVEDAWLSGHRLAQALNNQIAS